MKRVFKLPPGEAEAFDGQIDEMAHRVSLVDPSFVQHWCRWRKWSPDCVGGNKVHLSAQQLRQLCAYFFCCGMAHYVRRKERIKEGLANAHKN